MSLLMKIHELADLDTTILTPGDFSSLSDGNGSEPVAYGRGRVAIVVEARNPVVDKKRIGAAVVPFARQRHFDKLRFPPTWPQLDDFWLKQVSHEYTAVAHYGEHPRSEAADEAFHVACAYVVVVFDEGDTVVVHVLIGEEDTQVGKRYTLTGLR